MAFVFDWSGLRGKREGLPKAWPIWREKWENKSVHLKIDIAFAWNFPKREPSTTWCHSLSVKSTILFFLETTFVLRVNIPIIKCHILSNSISFIFTESDCLDNFTLFDYTHIYLIWPNIFKYVEGNFTRIVQEDAHCLFGGNCVICSAIPWTYYSWRSLLCSMSRVKSAQ